MTRRTRKPIPWDKLAPPGVDGRRAGRNTIILVATWGICMLLLLRMEYNTILSTVQRHMMFGYDWQADPFDDRLQPPFLFLLQGASIFFGIIANNYLSYYRESRGVYLMRRVPDRWELHRRALTLPLLGLAALLVLFAGLIVGLFLMYQFCYPPQYLPPYRDQGPVYQFLYHLFF